MSDIKNNSNKNITRIFPANFDSLNPVREFVAKQASGMGFSEKGVYAFQMAVDEAFTNIVEHAYGGECHQDVECTCLTGERYLTVIMKDCGDTFDPQNVPEPDLDTDLANRPVGGLGLFLIRQLMDEVTFETEPNNCGEGECTILKMTKALDTPP
jgi:serine/threonine-protein kinase RsbW